ncbi:cAMP-regulated phosphoprotein 19 isoform X2 [Rhea pennata]|uniref:cAMP-regulated phosphoprotein 19 isoform X2 n=1 Tax=Rhea pennata TaxID=8795 RepID=UPI002E263343
MSAESAEPASAEEQKEMEDKVISPEKAEEAKLKARYPHLGQKPGGSDFLRKRLQKGTFICLQLLRSSNFIWKSTRKRNLLKHHFHRIDIQLAK